MEEFVISDPDVKSSMFGDTVNQAYLADEVESVERLMTLARVPANTNQRIRATAEEIIATIREANRDTGGLQAFLQHYDLSSNEGVVLMCLAEALLRIPDSATVDAFIADKLTSADWQQHLGESESLFVNASTWALMLTGRVLNFEQTPVNDPLDLLGKLVARLEEPVLRASLKSAMEIMAAEFVMGRTIEEALKRARSEPFSRYRFSYDMLGEAALTESDAKVYQQAYLSAIVAVGGGVNRGDTHPGVSVKLSALYPRFEPDHNARAVPILTERVLELALAASNAGVQLTIDAEEADRLQMTLKVFEQVYHSLTGTPETGFGLAVQAYQKRALDVLKWLNELSRKTQRTIAVRLVKGAYWDTEIKRAQEQGLREYPVFTLKRNTDLSYLACARYILSDCPYLFGQFATHNAHTVSYVYHHAGKRPFEFQRLHGMGEELYGMVTKADGLNAPCRVYAPVGAHEDLLPYLVRRLLENGANTSFVNRINQSDTPISTLVADPVALIDDTPNLRRHQNIALPSALFQPERINSSGINFADASEVAPLLSAIASDRRGEWVATPFINGKVLDGRSRSIRNPAKLSQIIGEVADGDAQAAAHAVDVASGAFNDWCQSPASWRADMLDRAADLFEENRAELVGLCAIEAGKTLRDGTDDVREAVDFLRYYAAQSRTLFSQGLDLPGATGESNELYWRGRGVFICISPWNFPAAIFVGQIAAALAAGNTVVAKPAEQTSLIAWRLCELLYAAGVPKAALAFLPGDGATLGNVLLSDTRVAGVAFTGSVETARTINRTLAERDCALPTLIAETGGINVMVVDSSALPEHVVRDAVTSAFNSAGQRCSALRLLCLQEEIAPRVLELLTGFMDTWAIADPAALDSDMGPVIDKDAYEGLEAYVARMTDERTLRYRGSLPLDAGDGYFVAPAIIEVDAVSDLRAEVFGPILHVLRYRASDLSQLLEQINDLGYGLTLGIQSRIGHRAREIRDRIRVGNVYVNRNMIGAVVGAQPFGGTGLSGTGPKAGGPHYLLRFATEQTYTVNTAAIGGNASLLSIDPHGDLSLDE